MRVEAPSPKPHVSLVLLATRYGASSANLMSNRLHPLYSETQTHEGALIDEDDGWTRDGT